MLKLLQAFFKWQPKPLHHNQFVTVFNNLYQISSEYPATITYKDNGELLAKAVGKVHLYCDGKLVLRLTKNVSVITIGVVDNKAKVINIKKDVFRFPSNTSSSHLPYLSPSSDSDSHHHTSRSDDNHSGHFSGGDSGGGDCGGGGGGD